MGEINCQSQKSIKLKTKINRSEFKKLNILFISDKFDVRMEQVVEKCNVTMESSLSCERPSDNENFTKTPKPFYKSPGTSPSIRSMTQTVIVSLAETVTHNITYGKYVVLLTDIFVISIIKTSMLMFMCERRGSWEE